MVGCRRDFCKSILQKGRTLDALCFRNIEDLPSRGVIFSGSVYKVRKLDGYIRKDGLLLTGVYGWNFLCCFSSQLCWPIARPRLS